MTDDDFFLMVLMFCLVVDLTWMYTYYRTKPKMPEGSGMSKLSCSISGY